MKSIFIIRHAEAEDLIGIPDSCRGLTKRGSKQAHEMGNVYNNLPPFWLVSNAVRTYATAMVLSQTQLVKPEIHLRPQLYMSNFEHYLNEIHALPETIDSVVIVGHNPSVSELFFELTREYTTFKKGAVAELKSASVCWNEISIHTCHCVSFKVPTV
jgi:phosphohistidine phosphatase